MEQFLRTRLLLGNDRFKRLARSKVTVIGLGAVGSHAAEALVRAGVGNFRLVDFDRIKTTNINRQLHALHSTLGKKKVEVARDRLLDINPACSLELFDIFAAQESFPSLFDNAPDLVIDAIDALNPKVQLLVYCYQNHIPVISSMGAALRTDPFSITAGDVLESRHCPLAERMRRLLRKRGVGKGITCVYSLQSPQTKGVDADQLSESGDFSRGRKRQILGSLPTITGMFGYALANCAIERLTAAHTEGKSESSA